MDKYAPLQFSGPDGQEDMPYLLAPDAVTTSRGVKLAMMADWGQGDSTFKSSVKSIQEQLKTLAGCNALYDCVVLQGSGALAVEAALGSLTPTEKTKTLVIANGATGDRAATILSRLKRPFLKIDKGDGIAPSAEDVEPLLDADPAISHVWMVHCEIDSGLINPIRAIGKAVGHRNRVFIVDANATFGSLPLDMVEDGIDVMVSSSGNCIESVPGVAFVVVRRDLLQVAAGKSHSVALDLHTQWKAMEEDGQFSSSPPTHAIMALHQALAELAEEGGVAARGARYWRNTEVLVSGLSKLGLTPLLTGDTTGPVMQTFLSPRDLNFSFEAFAAALRAKGFAIAPSMQAKRSSFRIGTIGKVDALVMERLVHDVDAVLQEMNVTDLAPLLD